MASREELEILLRAKDEASKVIDGVAKSTSGLSGNLTDSAKAGAAFGIGMETATKAAEQLINVALAAARAVGVLAEKGEEIAKKALISGFAVESVQQLKRLADNAKISSDSVFKAISRMQRAAVDGRKGFTELGLGAQEFLSLAPEAQLQAVADRIMALPTAAERAAAAMDLFGRAGAEILPILADLSRGSEALAVTLSDDQVKAIKNLDTALDNLSGAWTDLSDQFFAAIATSPDVANAIDGIALTVSRLAQYLKDSRPALELYVALLARMADLDKTPRLLGILLERAPKPKTPVFGPAAPTAIEQEIADPTKAWRAMDLGAGTVAMQRAAIAMDRERERSAKKLADELERLEQRQIDGARKVEEAQLKIWDSLDKAAAAHTKYMMELDEREWAAQEKILAEEERETERIAREESRRLDQAERQNQEYVDSLGSIADAMLQIGEAEENLFGDILVAGSAAIQVFANLSDKALQAATNTQKAAVAAQGLAAAYQSGGALKGAGKGAAAGAAFGPWGAAIGAVVGGVAGWLGGRDKEIKQVNDLRDAFFEAHGGWLELQKDLANLTDQDLVARIFNAKTVEQFNAAVAEAMNLLDTQARAQEELQAAIEKYGITIEELGPKFAQQELDKQAAQLLKEFELLSAAGVDVNTLIAKMGPGLVEFVNTSIAAGATIPEAMRPVIEQLIAQGLLLDENGEAYTSAEDAGIRFAETLTESMQSVIEEIRNLVAALTGVPNVSRTVTVTTVNRTTSEDEGDSGKGKPPDMAHGGIIGRNVLPFIPRAAQGFVTAHPGGSPVIAGEGGETELVAPVRALAREIGAAAAAAAGGGSGVQHIHVHVDGKEIADVVIRQNRAGRLPIAASSIRKD